MKKLFISCPMRNRTEYAIKASMEQMHRIAEAVFGEELEVIPTYFEGDPPENSNQALWYLGESIKKMSEANYFIGIPSYIVNVSFIAPDVIEQKRIDERVANLEIY